MIVAAVAEALEARRLLAAGDLDPTFSGDGRQTINLGFLSAGSDVAVQADGKIVVAGAASSPSGATSDAVVVRFNTDGSLDGSFGSGGVARIDFGGNEFFTSVAILGNGKIVAGGQHSDGQWLLARFTSGGVRDAGSGFGGTDGVQLGAGRIDELALQGNQIITGSFGIPVDHNLVRRHDGATGAVDTTFGTGGSAVIANAIPELANFRFLDDLVVQSDGKIVVVGMSDGREGDAEEAEERGEDPLDYADRVMAVGRLTINGAADGSFGINGGVRKGLDNEGTSASAVGIRPSDGAIFVAGTDGGPDANLVRLSSAGAVTGTTHLPSGSSDVMRSASVLIDGAGRIIVAGSLFTAETDTEDFVVVRFNADFTRDLTFSGDGEAYVHFPETGAESNDRLGAAALDPQGRIVLGSTSSDNDQRIAVARLLALDTDPTAPSIALSGGVLVARGTGAADVFTVRRTGADDVIVTVNSLSRTFDMDDFTGVRLEGLGGDDQFRLLDPLTSPRIRQTTIVGGNGRDTLDYSTRTAALKFEGYFEPTPGTTDPFALVTSGLQTDRVGADVEVLIGGNGNDEFVMNDENDLASRFVLPVAEVTLMLDGRGGNDVFGSPTNLAASLLGGAGDDLFSVANDATDFFSGGDGNDRFEFADFGVPESLDAGPGTDTIGVISSRLSVIEMSLYPGLENLDGAGFNVRHVVGNDLNNLITVDPNAPAGDRVTLRGGNGNDTLTGSRTDDSLLGEGGDDSLVGGFGDDTLDGGAGTDTADGGPGNNVILNAEITPSAPNIRIASRILIADGSWGQDFITIERTGADDVIVRVNNTSRTFDMDAFDGVLLRGNNGYDEIRILQPISAGSLVRKVTLEGGNGDDTLAGSAGDDVLRGGDGNDQLDGGFGNDALFGGGGNDALIGLAGADFLDGGDGNDFLDALDSFAGDTVIGGNGTDRALVDGGDQVSGVETFL
jgi:uncharacterized delta-60 repeat protein